MAKRTSGTASKMIDLMEALRKALPAKSEGEMTTSAYQPLRVRIAEVVRLRPGRSAYEIAQHLDADPSSIASLCLRLTKKGVLRREAGEGPRKGFGYYIVDQNSS